MKKILLLLVLLRQLPAAAQELYVFSEPASNMPAHTITPRLTTLLDPAGKNGQRYLGEAMIGFSRNLMLHAGASFYHFPNDATRWESVFLYGKYRFLSKDDVHEHFRMAAFAQAAYNRHGAIADELNLQGDRSGVQLGLIATKLKGRAAVSATVAHTQSLDEARFLKSVIGDTRPYQSLDYSLSAGLLLLPATYTSYRQLNLNAYVELLGQRARDQPKFFTDLAPAVQLIFNSNSKLNIGYRFQVGGNETRMMKRGLLLSFEHTFFNVGGGRRG